MRMHEVRRDPGQLRCQGKIENRLDEIGPCSEVVVPRNRRGPHDPVLRVRLPHTVGVADHRHLVAPPRKRPGHPPHVDLAALGRRKRKGRSLSDLERSHQRPQR